MAAEFRSILVAGATGRLGRAIARGLLEVGFGDVRLLVRGSDKLEGDKRAVVDALVAAGARVVEGNLSPVAAAAAADGEDGTAAAAAAAAAEQKRQLGEALRGVDVVVSAVSGGEAVAAQLVLVAAAKEAGVRRFVPSDFGEDYRRPRPDGCPANAFLDAKVAVRRAIADAGMEITSFAPGAFCETLLAPHLLGADWRADDARLPLLGDGTQPIDVTTVADIGRFVAAALRAPPAATANRVLCVRGCTLTYAELLALLERARNRGPLPAADPLPLAELSRRAASPVFLEALVAFVQYVTASGILHNPHDDSPELFKFHAFTPTTVRDHLGL